MAARRTMMAVFASAWLISVATAGSGANEPIDPNELGLTATDCAAQYCTTKVNRAPMRRFRPPCDAPLAVGHCRRRVDRRLGEEWMRKHSIRLFGLRHVACCVSRRLPLDARVRMRESHSLRSPPYLWNVEGLDVWSLLVWSFRSVEWNQNGCRGVPGLDECSSKRSLCAPPPPPPSRTRLCFGFRWRTSASRMRSRM